MAINFDSSYFVEQMQTCEKFGAEFFAPTEGSKVGISPNVRTGLQPINGLRHPPIGDTSGWYIWAGEELSDSDDFFVPLHIEHLDDWCPAIKKFLGLPPGWRFLIAPDYEDAWFDETLLQPE